MVGLKISSYMHKMHDEYRPLKSFTVRRRKTGLIPWQLATTAIAVVRCSSGWGSQKNADQLLRFMKAGFSRIYFPHPAVGP